MRSRVRQYPVMTKHLTPAQTAIRAKCGRSTVMRALEREDLKGIRDNRGRWKITPEAVDDWVSMRPDRSDDGHRPKQVPDSNHDHEIVTARIEIATLTAERNGLINRLADAHAEHARLRADADQLRADADQLRADADRVRAELGRAQEPLLTRIRRSLTGKGA